MATGGDRVMAVRLACRIGLIAFAGVAFAWSAGLLASGRLSTRLDDVAGKVLRGEAFRAEDLEALVPRVIAVGNDPAPRPAALRSATVIALRQAEAAVLDGRRIEMDERLATLGRLLDRALATMPTDAYLWLALFWHRNAVSGFTPGNLALLERSYALGPAEGWIGVRRIRVALVFLSRLPPALQEQVVQEFARLVNARFSDMPAILAGPGWPVRERLVAALASASEESRTSFRQSLIAMGIDIDIDIPGLARPADRPWSR